MLWFLSLTFSLLAAFFALAVQQWLRAYVLPKHLSVRDSIRLRQSRYDDLIICQVPNIILFLPVVLQAAVVLFLIGVFYLLRSLSHPIMAAFSVVAGVPFFFYAFSLVLPLIWPSCPFKSPLVPATVVVLNWCLVPLALVAFVFVFVPAFIVGLISNALFSTCRRRPELDTTRSLLRRGAIQLHILLISILQNAMSVTVRTFGQMNEFWTTREVRNQAHKPEESVTDNDQWALEWVISEVPEARLAKIKPCLYDLPLANRRQCVLNWLACAAGDWDESVYLSGNWCPVDPTFLSRLNPNITHQYRDYLMDALPEDWESCDRIREDETVSCVLVLLTQMIRRSPVDEQFIALFTQRLLNIWASQRVEELKSSYQSVEEYGWVHMPISCLFHVLIIKPAKFDMHETLRLISSTRICLSELSAFNPGFTDRTSLVFTSAKLVLTSTAVALLAVRQQLPTASPQDRLLLQEKSLDILALFDQFLSIQSRDIQFLCSVCLDHPKMTMFDCTSQALESIADSLCNLSEAELLLPGSPSEALVQHLLQTCKDHPALKKAFTSLSLFNTNSSSRRVAKHLGVGGPVLPILTSSLATANRTGPHEVDI